MKKLLVCIVALCGLVACDRATAPSRSLTASAPRFGDFIIRAEGYRFPDTVKAGDAVSIPFTVGDGRDQCSYSTQVTTWFARVIYFVPWGVDVPRSVCRTPTFKLVAPYPGAKMASAD